MIFRVRFLDQYYYMFDGALDVTLLSRSGVSVQDIVYQENASFVNELGTLTKLRRL